MEDFFLRYRDQVLYHLEERGIESEILPWCKKNGLALVGYSPFGSTNGFPSPKSAGGKVLAQVAAKHGKTSRQAALAFLARDPHVFLIPKAEKVEAKRDFEPVFSGKHDNSILGVVNKDYEAAAVANSTFDRVVLPVVPLKR